MLEDVDVGVLSGDTCWLASCEVWTGFGVVSDVVVFAFIVEYEGIVVVPSPGPDVFVFQIIVVDAGIVVLLWVSCAETGV